MDRHSPCRARRIVAATLVLATLAASGCAPILTVLYLAGGADTPAEFPGLKKKKVVVACRPMVQLQYRDANVSNSLARQVGQLLRKNVSKIQVVDYAKVEQWLDSNTSDSYVEIGRALDADMVVGIDLLDFSVYQGQTLYQGKANYTIKVYDCTTGELVFDKKPDQSVWPPNSAVPTSEKQESEFRQRFVGVLADEIARRFYSHDPRVNFASDATAL